MEELARQAAYAIHTARSSQTDVHLAADLTHMLYQPLIGLNGYIDLTLQEVEGTLNDSQKKFLGEAHKNAVRISRLVNGTHTLARLESGQLLLNLTSLDLAECAKDCLTEPSLAPREHKLMEAGLRPEDIPLSFSKLSQFKQLTLNLHLSDLPPVRANHDWLFAVITSLLDNAVKYTPAHGDINVTATVQNSFVRLSVQDTGYGIPANEQGYIFNPWSRGWQSPVHETPGVGLDLYIAKQYIDLMGGTIGFESEPGKGSTFWFTLPIAEPVALGNS